METETHADFIDAWRLFVRGRTAVGLLAVIALGTMGFGMADVLLEPYGGQVLDLTVAHDDTADRGLARRHADRVRHRLRVLGCGRDPADVAGGARIGASRPSPPSSLPPIWAAGALRGWARWLAGSAPACSATAR
jgi:BCD family chlorophyll transporter-like MFS transporter